MSPQKIRTVYLISGSGLNSSCCRSGCVCVPVADVMIVPVVDAVHTRIHRVRGIVIRLLKTKKEIQFRIQLNRDLL